MSSPATEVAPRKPKLVAPEIAASTNYQAVAVADKQDGTNKQ